jgi:hypothetical protein
MNVWEWLFLGVLVVVFPVLIPVAGVCIGGATSPVTRFWKTKSLRGKTKMVIFMISVLIVTLYLLLQDGT